HSSLPTSLFSTFTALSVVISPSHIHPFHIYSDFSGQFPHPYLKSRHLTAKSSIQKIKKKLLNTTLNQNPLEADQY
ncbi:MAG: hypothetical protein PF447_14360, partial [Spirochaetaceae bacterium]|nr:hypothetical protein [Spirochaetaceae bacterium]